jgi:hypothetical protein
MATILSDGFVSIEQIETRTPKEPSARPRKDAAVKVP